MMRKNFTTTMLFKRDDIVAMTGEGFAGGKHLKHVLREKTQRDLPKNEDGSPMIKVFGDPDVIKNQPKAKQKNQEGFYYEVMTYAYKDEDVQKVMDYLKERYQREVCAVTHYDEMKKVTSNKDGLEKTPHTHFLVSFRDSEGKGLRIRQSNWIKDRKEVAVLIGQTLTPAGIGARKSMKQREFIALQRSGNLDAQIKIDEEAQRARIAAMIMTAQKETPTTMQSIEADSIVENTPMKKGELVGSITHDLTNNIIDNQHGITPEPKPQYSAQAENVAPSKSEDVKPIVVALTDDDISHRQEIFKRIQKDVATMNAPFIYRAKKGDNVVKPEKWKEGILNKKSTHEDMKKWIPWFNRKEKEGYRIEKRVYIPALSMGASKKAKNVIDIKPEPPKQKQQAETVRIPFTPGR